MYILDSIANMIPDYQSLGYLSLKNYFNPYDVLKYGEVDIAGIFVLIIITVVVLVLAMFYFNYKDIKV